MYACGLCYMERQTWRDMVGEIGVFIIKLASGNNAGFNPMPSQHFCRSEPHAALCRHLHGWQRSIILSQYDKNHNLVNRSSGSLSI